MCFCLETIQVVVPLGLKSFFLERGYANITELDWHDEIKIHNIKLSSLPAVHHSGRNLSDRNKMLWSSWAITSSDKKLYFVGDSAYSDIIFKDIGGKYGPFDYAFKAGIDNALTKNNIMDHENRRNPSYF
jgi:L-ascorbate metabolism protein UlaG (beta-lactamase superfamily)